MYPSSSSSQTSMGITGLASAQLYPSETNPNDNVSRAIGLQPPYGFPLGGAAASSSVVRQSSSSAGFLDQLATTTASSHDNGFSIRGLGSYNPHGGIAADADSSRGIVSRLNSELNFTHQEANISNSKMFTVESRKRANSLDSMESQFQFGVPESALEAATMEKLLHIPQDSVACKIRAKRGHATHPRSIAERERRTRISGKLKKLQDLVPNMDKQTSYSDMLDLAVQHIKRLQGQVKKLNEELDSCTCGCRKRDGGKHIE